MKLSVFIALHIINIVSFSYSLSDYQLKVQCAESLLTDDCSLSINCIADRCNQCIMQSSLNPFDLYCIRLTACVCNYYTSDDCIYQVESLCY